MPTIDDRDLRAVRFVLAEFVRRRRLTGQPIPTVVARLHQHLAMSANGPEPVAAQSDSTPAQPELLDTGQVAELLGCTTRHVRRIAPALDAQRISGRWVYPRPAVTQHLQGKRTA
ncbi:helix-turn-helix domain-containing protein [Gordonia bronchialis]|uniref:helix-turn-helix domain-containing protein n=1 Tax=Gordonia bronchialis TaxID=2054 RepID=UPI001CBB7031|nr:helix-turn-helix domain-containing protein [Gordonia bronchialis]UAK38560.1 helix-turn-helix domain-containing protein [Gordonia bronchialis]